MITPLDIQNKEFKKTMMGYKTKEVDGYLDFINTDYEKLYKENVELKDKIGVLSDQIRQYNSLEETLKNTLVIAQTTADEVTQSARKKASLIVEEAELNAKNKISNAIDEVKHIKMEYEQLKKEMFVFKARYESFIKSQLSTLEDFYNDFEDSSRKMSNLEIDQTNKIEDVDRVEDIEKFADDTDHLEAE